MSDAPNPIRRESKVSGENMRVMHLSKSIVSSCNSDWCGNPKGVVVVLKKFLNTRVTDELLVQYTMKGYDSEKAVFDGNAIRLVANIIHILVGYTEGVLDVPDECEKLSDLPMDELTTPSEIIANSVIVIGESTETKNTDEDDCNIASITRLMMVGLSEQSYITDDELVAGLVISAFASFITGVCRHLAYALGNTPKKIKAEAVRVAIMGTIAENVGLGLNLRACNLAYIALLDSIDNTKYVKPAAAKKTAAKK